MKQDEIEFEKGKKQENGPKITAHLLKNAKRYASKEEKPVDEQSNVKSTYKKQAARKKREGKMIAEEIVYVAIDDSKSENKGGNQ